MGGDWPVGLTVTKAHSDYSFSILLFYIFLSFFGYTSHDVRHRTQSLDALSSEIAWAYPRKSLGASADEKNTACSRSLRELAYKFG